jgi:hypothetical protein
MKATGDRWSEADFLADFIPTDFPPRVPLHKTLLRRILAGEIFLPVRVRAHARLSITPTASSENASPVADRIQIACSVGRPGSQVVLDNIEGVFDREAVERVVFWGDFYDRWDDTAALNAYRFG